MTAPHGYDQPEIYETIDRSTASQIGRGKGSSLDDMYALGITIMFMMLGHNPAQHMNTIELLTEKIDRGTYAAISQSSRVPLPVIELLRGLLSDDEESRWSLEATEIWIDGRKKPTVQRRSPHKAKAPYTFQGRPHSSPRTLAYAFSLVPEEAFRTIKADETFETWVRRSLEDRDLSEKLKGMVEMASRGGSGGQHTPEIVISKVCMMLDPAGPIRYKNISFMIESFGTCFAYDMFHSQSPQTLLEIVTKELYEVWIKSQVTSSPDHALWHRQFLRCKSYLKVNELGFGPERALYELNKRIPCLSPLIKDEFITHIDDLLPAMDQAASHAEQDSRPIDRHIAGFIGARFSEDIHPHLRAMATPEPERSIIGVLSLLAFLQWKLKTSPLYGLSSWLGGLLGPAISTYHNRKTRKDLEREIPQLVRKGSLPELFDLIDNTEQRNEDDSGFLEARKEYSEAGEEIASMDGSDGTREENLLRSGQKAAAMVSIILSMMIVSILFMMYDW
ncbi:MAG: hypothetical protein HON65_15535 [Rhodospirillales bacterium]|nr:hypothetical protein [Rhodospirillales bacterium]